MPLVLFVHSAMGEETKADNEQLVSDFSNKLDRSYLVACGYVCACLSLNLVRSFILIMQGLRGGKTQPIRQIPADRVEASRLVMRGD